MLPGEVQFDRNFRILRVTFSTLCSPLLNSAHDYCVYVYVYAYY